MAQQEFVDGLMVKPPHERAPEFVKGKISMKRDALIAWLQGRTEEWVNCDIKVGKSGKWYVSVDQWKRQEGEQPAPQATYEQPAPKEEYTDDGEIKLEDIPF